MADKIQLKHPDGKKAPAIDQYRYDLLSTAVLNYLEANPASTHTDMWQSIEQDLKKKKTPFEGSVQWYLEWVKLDLEAKGKIKRDGKASPLRFSLK